MFKLNFEQHLHTHTLKIFEPACTFKEAKSRKYQGVFKVKSRVKTWQFRGIWSTSKSQKEGVKTSVRKGMRYLLACHIRSNCSIEKLFKCRFPSYSIIVLFVHLINFMCSKIEKVPTEGMFEVNGPEKITTSSGKGSVSTSRTYERPKSDGTTCPEE